MLEILKSNDDAWAVTIKHTQIENKLIVKSNRIIEARYKLTLGEQRILYLLASTIDPHDEEFKSIKISIKDLADLFDLGYSGKLIDEVFASLKRLRNREFTPYAEDLKAQRGAKSRVTVGWINEAEYIEGGAAVEIKLSDTLKPYYLNLKEKFTQIPFMAITYFKSAYAVRFYEMMKLEAFKADKSGRFKRSFEYEKLREQLGIQEGEYTYIKDFRMRVIEPAVKDISKHTDIYIENIEYKAKVGKKITTIIFHCAKSKQGSFPLGDDAPMQAEQAAIEHIGKLQAELFGLGIAEEKAKALIAKHGEERVRRNIDYFISFRKTGATIKNPSGYLIDAIDKDYAIAQLTLESTQKAKATKIRVEQETNERAEKALEQLKKKQVSTIITAFDALSIDAQANILDAFKKQLTDFAWSAFEKYGHRHASQRYIFARYCIAPLQEQTGQVFELSMNS